MQKNCKNCQEDFKVFDSDIAFYKKINVPSPTFCPSCRFQRRAMYRNERCLYKRTCNLCEKSIITIYSDENTFPIYCSSCFWSDNWNPLNYGRNFNFERPFFEQWQELRDKVPRIALLSKNSENCEYTNHASRNRNCYMSTVIFGSEDVYFSRKIFSSKSICDCTYIITKGENLYECFWCSNIFNSSYSVFCHNSSNLQFCYDCRSCSDCFMSSNLRNKKYVFRNKQLTKTEYKNQLESLDLGSYKIHEELKIKYNSLVKQAIKPALRNENTENSTGDFLFNTKDCFECYYSQYGENCRYCIEIDLSVNNQSSKNCMDSFGFGSSEWIYEINAMANGHNNQFCNLSYNVTDSKYLDSCFNIKNCFGCIGLHSKEEFCILNKSYSQKEYNNLIDSIIKHMKQSHEYGEFFPSKMTPFCYNETLAQEFMPMTNDQVLSKGWQCCETKKEFQTQTYKTPDHIKAVSDDITKEILACEICKQNYFIINQELKFYQKNKIPIPRKCPNCRHHERLKFRNPYKLFNQKCQKCSTSIQTTFTTNKAENIYCEKCYLQEIY